MLLIEITKMDGVRYLFPDTVYISSITEKSCIVF